MAVKEEQLVIVPTMEQLMKLTNFGVAKQRALVSGMFVADKPTQDPPIPIFDDPFFDYEFEFIFTGGGFVIRVKKRRKKGLPRRKTYASFKKEVDSFLAKDFTVKKTFTVAKVTYEFVNNADKEDRLILVIPKM